MLTLVNKEINGGKCLLIILACMRLILYEDSGLCNKFKSSSLHYARIATPTEQCPCFYFYCQNAHSMK